MLVLNRTKIGLLIRAGVENREMVEALGYRIDRLFVGVFMAGSALAGLGGVMLALYRGQVHASMGGEFLVLCFIVIIIGGLGSVGGSFIAAMLVALIANYARLSRAETGAGVQHPADGRGAAVAPARALSGERTMTTSLRRSAARPRAASRSSSSIVAGAGAGAVPVSRRQGDQHRRQDLRIFLLVASYDVLLGYTGIVSFAHAMFFGVGAYGAGLALYALGPSWGAVATGLAVACALALALALAIGLFSLRVQAIFFAMVTLAVAYAFNVLASQLSWLTGGEDGRSFKVPRRSAARVQMARSSDPRRAGERQAPGLLSALRRRRRSPSSCCSAWSTRRSAGCCRRSGRTRSAPRRSAIAPSFTERWRPASPRSARRSPGALSALWLRYVGPDTALCFSIQVDVLVMVVVGGMGTLYGAIIGAALFVLAENYLQDLMGALSQLAADARLPLLPALFHPGPLAPVARPRLRAGRLFRADRDHRGAEAGGGERGLGRGAGGAGPWLVCAGGTLIAVDLRGSRQVNALFTNYCGR